MNDFFVHSSSIVEPSAIVGRGTKIWHFSHIMENAVVGENCNIGQNVVVSPFVNLGNNVKVQNNARAFISRKSEFRNTTVKRGASIGANATIVCGTVIGEYSMVGAGAVVTKNVPAYALVVGNPAKQVGWVSEYGCKLEFDEKGEAKCTESGQCYRMSNGKVERIV